MQLGIWDESLRLERLSQLGDSLERLDKAVDWELFRPQLTKVFKKEAKGAGGRPPYDYVMLFKVLVLQRIYNLSDDQTEYQINDRISFMRFLGLHLGDRVPDAKTIWHFRDTLTKADVIRELFDVFNRQLEEAHLITRTGTIVDATFVEAPRQRNNKEERKDIKEGKVPEAWKKEGNKHKLRQKDMDATWTRKGNQTYFGYKDHVKADADSAYWGKTVAEALPEGVKNCIHERGTKNKPLTEEQRANNNAKSKVRCRVEHIFGFMTQSMHGITVRSIGIKRAEFNIGLSNLIYNLCRYEYLHRAVATVA